MTSMVKSVSINRLYEVSETGDCLLFKGRNLISRLIMHFTEYSHAAILVKMPNVLYMVEATMPKCRLSDPFKTIAHSKEAYLFKPRWITEENRKCILTTALNIVASGINYDIKSLFKNIIARTSVDAETYFCSELVWDIWVDCGIAPSWVITAPRPGDIPRRLQGQLFVIKKEDTQ